MNKDKTPRMLLLEDAKDGIAKFWAAMEDLKTEKNIWGTPPLLEAAEMGALLDAAMERAEREQEILDRQARLRRDIGDLMGYLGTGAGKTATEQALDLATRDFGGGSWTPPDGGGGA